MSRHLKKLIVFVFIAHLFCLGSVAQTKGKKSTQELFAELREDEKSVAECEQKAREYQSCQIKSRLPVFKVFLLKCVRRFIIQSRM